MASMDELVKFIASEAVFPKAVLKICLPQERVTALPVSVVVVDDLKNSTTCADGETDTDTVLTNASCKTPEVSFGINFTEIVLETPEIFISFSKSPPDDAAGKENFVSQTISAPVLAF